MAKQNRGLGGLHCKRNRLGFQLLLIFILALVMNIALSSSTPTQNVRLRRDVDGEEEQLSPDSAEDGSEPKTGGELNSTNAKADKKPKPSNDPEFDDMDADDKGQPTEDQWPENSPNPASDISTTTSAMTSPKSQQEDSTPAKNEESGEDEGDDDDVDDTDVGEYVEEPSTMASADPAPESSELSNTDTTVTETTSSIEAVATIESTNPSENSPTPNSSISNDSTSPATTNKTSALQNQSKGAASLSLINTAVLIINVLLLHLSC